MIEVACAVIEHQGKVLIAQRPAHHHLSLKWEFPGGKIRSGEDPAQTVVREIQEELGISITPLEQLPANHHLYPNQLQITLIPYWCKLLEGSPTNHEHAQIKWVTIKQLMDFEWCEADLPIVRHIIDRTMV